MIRRDQYERSSGLPSMKHRYSRAIPPTQLVVPSYSAYTEYRGIPNPTNAVGGSFISEVISRLHDRRARLGMNHPPTALVVFKEHAAFSLVGWV